MAEITGTETIKEYLELLKGALEKRKELFQKSIKPGADIVADYCKAELNNLRVDDTPYIFISQYNKKRGLSQKQKEGLIKSMGLAPLKKKQDGWDVKLGFDGYNDIKSSRWKNGQPNAMIARSVNKGTSFMVAQPYMDRTIVATEYKADKAIEEEFIKLFKDYIKG